MRVNNILKGAYGADWHYGLFMGFSEHAISTVADIEQTCFIVHDGNVAEIKDWSD